MEVCCIMRACLVTELEKGHDPKEKKERKGEGDGFLSTFLAMKFLQKVQAKNGSHDEDVTASHFKVEEDSLFQNKKVCQNRLKGDPSGQSFFSQTQRNNS